MASIAATKPLARVITRSSLSRTTISSWRAESSLSRTSFSSSSSKSPFASTPSIFSSSSSIPSRCFSISRPANLAEPQPNANSQEQPRIRLGFKAPNFSAQTTLGPIEDFHKWIGDSWAVLFSHPADFTPVCTTELGAFAKLKGEFEKRGVKMIGLSANDLNSHGRWIQDINETQNSNVQFPIIADPDRKVAWLYDMLDYQDTTNIDSKGIAFTIRSVFIIDPSHKIRLTMLYPASVGRNTTEVLRAIDSLQLGDKKGVTTPVDWTVGDDVIVPPTVSTEDARKKFGDVREVKSYLRYTNVGK